MRTMVQAHRGRFVRYVSAQNPAGHAACASPPARVRDVACGCSRKNSSEVPLAKQYSVPSSGSTQLSEQSALIRAPAATPSGSRLSNSPRIGVGGTAAFQMPPLRSARAGEESAGAAPAVAAAANSSKQPSLRCEALDHGCILKYYQKKGKFRLPASRKNARSAGGDARRCRRMAPFFLMATCARLRRYHPAPLAPARGAEEFAARRLDAVRIARRAEAPDAADVDVAAAGMGSSRIAGGRFDAKSAARGGAGAGQLQTRSREITAAQAPNPDLTLQSEYARHDAHPWLYGVELNWLLRIAANGAAWTPRSRGSTRGNARLQLMDEAWSVRKALAAALSAWESGRRRAEPARSIGNARRIG